VQRKTALCGQNQRSAGKTPKPRILSRSRSTKLLTYQIPAPLTGLGYLGSPTPIKVPPLIAPETGYESSVAYLITDSS